MVLLDEFTCLGTVRSTITGIKMVVDTNFSMLDSADNFDTELKEHYWPASLLLPLGSIVVLTIVVLLMVLFRRCPHIIAGVVAGLLGTIIIFVILMSMSNAPVYT